MGAVKAPVSIPAAASPLGLWIHGADDVVQALPRLKPPSMVQVPICFLVRGLEPCGPSLRTLRDTVLRVARSFSSRTKL